ncbi:efflux RND transporter permease subunit [Oceanicoccus sp. KOV_DT_Chl]|uniref:efflux RND transporter permease subunit n=1 Tax=Oceanicoccus sp. KOV_DT_Chl TaxID=1904639 RepID=UPI000C7D04AF|nr:efflux RND transporter permease subunit [Oceanicoccus sp. KOV_DT_Chl]
MSTNDEVTANTVEHKGIIAWFAKNPVAANLLMIVIFAVGATAAFNVQKTLDPKIETNIITINMIYPGAAPEEVEQGIVFRIEEALKDIESIKKVEATSQESIANLAITVYEDYDVLTVLDEVKSAVDAISSFPEQAEKPIIKHLRFKSHAINLQVYGNMDEKGLKNFAESVKNELLSDPNIAYIDIFGARDYEITIEVPEITLRKYNLTLAQIAQTIRRSSLDLPGGAVKTSTGEIMLRTTGQAYQQYDFEQVVLITYPDGTRLTLGDIATINDGFVEAQGFAMFDNQFSINLTVYAVGDQDALEVSRAAKAYVKAKQKTLPPGLHIEYWADITYYLEGRLGMMLKNLVLGAFLVFLVLALFLDIKLAFWVMAGLPVCFLGTFILMPLEFIDVTLNMISLFGFLLILGIVVDDAIIIGESAYRATEEKGHSVNNVIEGVKRVATPATFGVLTTIVAFMPTIFTEGILAPFPAALGWVVILCLIFSLIESKWILPAHLAHSRPLQGKTWNKLNAIPENNNRKLNYFIEKKYMPFLMKCIRNRYTTMAIFVSMLILVAGLVTGGVVRYVLMPAIPGDFLRTDLEMVEGTPDHQTLAAHKHISNSLYEIDAEYKAENNTDIGLVNHIFSWGRDGRFTSSMMELTKSEVRSIDSNEIAKRWREKVGDIPGAKVLSISNMEDMGGPALGFKLIGSDLEQLKIIAEELEQQLATYEGTYDIRSSASAVQDEIKLSIKPGAEALGITLEDLGTQVRHAFYGAEAQRLQRGINEIKVMVRYPQEDRDTVANLENMYIRTPSGDELPFTSVAEITVAPGYNKTTRINSERAIKVTSQLNKALSEPSAITEDIVQNFMPQAKNRYPGLSYKLDGESEEAAKLLGSMFNGFFIALFGIYALLAIPLKSYLQPIIIMGVIPFGIIGAIIGHIFIGIPFDMMSFFGVIALSGVVVNDSLIMVDFVNKSTADGTDKFEAIVNSGAKRFRAILITSLTTFSGLLPMLMETSLQAKQVLPMAVSLGFGIIFSTVITLLLVPCLYMVLDDIAKFYDNLTGKKLAQAT